MDWILVATNATEYGNNETKQERIKREHRFDKAIRNQPKLKADELVKEGIDAYNAEVALKDSLVAAYDAGKLRSPRLIKQVQSYKTNK